MTDDPQPDRKTDPEAWQAWFNRQVGKHDDTEGKGHTRQWGNGTEEDWPQ